MIERVVVSRLVARACVNGSALRPDWTTGLGLELAFVGGPIIRSSMIGAGRQRARPRRSSKRETPANVRPRLPNRSMDPIMDRSTAPRRAIAIAIVLGPRPAPCLIFGLNELLLAGCLLTRRAADSRGEMTPRLRPPSTLVPKPSSPNPAPEHSIGRLARGPRSIGTAAAPPNIRASPQTAAWWCGSASPTKTT